MAFGTPLPSNQQQEVLVNSSKPQTFHDEDPVQPTASLPPIAPLKPFMSQVVGDRALSSSGLPWINLAFYYKHWFSVYWYLSHRKIGHLILVT